MTCEIDGLVLRGVQFGIGVLFEVLMAVRAHLFKIDGRVLGGMQFGGAGAGAVLGVTVFLHLDGRVHGGMQFGCWCWWWFGMLCGELFEVLVTVRAQFAILTPGCYRACR